MDTSYILPPEAWVSVTGHPKYEISNHARLKVVRSQHILSLKPQPDKYLQVFLPSAEGLKCYQVHRLVAQHFSPRPVGTTQVDHIDKNITNNAAWNLHWVTPSENVLRALSVSNNLITRKKLGALFKVRRVNNLNDSWKCFYDLDVAAAYYNTTKDQMQEPCYEYQNIVTKGDVDAEFREIPGTDYEITADGVLSRRGRQNVLKGSLNSGYIRTNVKVGGKSASLHRLVLLAWLGNPPTSDRKYGVNHKNGLKCDNRLENLEWSTQSENMLHAHRTGLARYGPRDIGVNKFELDGTFIERLAKIPPKASQAVSSKWNHFEGYLYSFKNTIENWTGAAIHEIFPEYDPLIHQDINFDKIRPYVSQNSRPVAQWDVSGNPITIHDNATTTKNTLGVSLAIVHRLVIAEEPIRKYTQHGYLRWATLADILDGLQFKPDIVDEVNEIFQLAVAKSSKATCFDFDFLRQYLAVTGTPRPRPVWRMDPDTGERVQRYASGKVAEHALGIGRSTVDQAVRKNVKAGGVFWEWADFSM